MSLVPRMSKWLLAAGRPLAARLYALLFAVTASWALWKSGLDGWALAPRLGLFAVLGLWMLVPWTRWALGLLLAIVVLIGTLALFAAHATDTLQLSF